MSPPTWWWQSGANKASLWCVSIRPTFRIRPGCRSNSIAVTSRDICLTEGRLVSIHGVRSIWVRRPGRPAAHARNPSEWLTAECGQALYGMLYATTARWMNHPAAAEPARHKPFQLRVAQHSGFAVRSTLVTTYPRAARDFAVQCTDIVVESASGPPTTDPPVALSTLDALGEELVSDSLVYRYDPRVSPDGLRGEEGTFSICSFWYVEALSRAGRVDDARLAFEKMLTYANHVGLYAEEIGRTGEQIGNFPQAFTHLALISAAFNLDRALG
ncbi:hypothetical protein SANTM175S_02168 [Streptomyces antimycoticus]